MRMQYVLARAPSGWRAPRLAARGAVCSALHTSLCARRPVATATHSTGSTTAAPRPRRRGAPREPPRRSRRTRAGSRRTREGVSFVVELDRRRAAGARMARARPPPRRINRRARRGAAVRDQGSGPSARAAAARRRASMRAGVGRRPEAEREGRCESSVAADRPPICGVRGVRARSSRARTALEQRRGERGVRADPRELRVVPDSDRGTRSASATCERSGAR